MADRYLCVHCRKHVAVTKDQRFRSHKDDGSGDVCMGTGERVSASQLRLGPVPSGAAGDVPVEGRDFGICPACSRKVKIGGDGRFDAHGLWGVDRFEDCHMSWQPYDPSEEICQPANVATAVTADFSLSSPNTSTSEAFRQPETTSAVLLNAPAEASPASPGAFAAAATPPPSPFLQPAARPPADTPQPMTLLGEQIAARYKELFFHHVENSARSKQRTLGPSEAGDPCDRRIGAALLGLPAVNPGGSGWAPFKGTAIHAALAAMFEEADAGSGRFAVEQKLTLPNVNVPRGTCDLIDRTLVTVVDHKVVGRWRLDSIRSKGPSTTYRVQAHLYGFAARLAGEAVDHIAIIAWPMESSNLDDMHVHVEPYDAGIALAALERVDRIAAAVQADGIDAYRQLPVTSGGCDWCPMHLKDVRGVRADGACNGRE